MDEPPDRDEPGPLELDTEPTLAGRIARWAERMRIVRSQVEAARSRHATVDLGFELVERDSTIGGGILGGALAYRLFVFLLPLALFFVSGVGIYADTTGTTPSEVVAESGITGLIASEVAQASTSSARWVIFIVTLPVLVYATGMLYRATAIVHAIAWHGTGRAVRLTPRGFGCFVGVVVALFASVAVVGWIRDRDQTGGILAAIVAYGGLVGTAWLVLSLHLPRRDVSWRELLPGAGFLAGGMLLVNSFNVYVTTRLVEERADTYGALGIAAALLFSLYIVGRLVVGSAVLNATLDNRRNRRQDRAHDS